MSGTHCENCIWWKIETTPDWGYCVYHEKDMPKVSACPYWIQNPVKEDNDVHST